MSIITCLVRQEHVNSTSAIKRPFRSVLSLPSPIYDDLWTAAKAMYKTEPIVEGGGEVIISYAEQCRCHPSAKLSGVALRRIPRYLVFAPSLLFGLAGAIWLRFHPLRLEAQAGPFTILFTAALLASGLLGGAWLLEKRLPSFRFASKLLERALIALPISLPLALALAAATAVSEELFFRGALLPLLGVWGQALVFGLFHPAPLKAWSYTVYTFVAGLLFGYAVLYTGSLWAPIVAHFTVNLSGFLELRRLQRKRAVRFTAVENPADPAPDASV